MLSLVQPRAGSDANLRIERHFHNFKPVLGVGLNIEKVSKSLAKYDGAAIHKEIEIQRSKEFVWDAIRDVGSIHKRLVPGFVVDCVLDGDWRTVTFANGMVVRELIVKHSAPPEQRVALILCRTVRPNRAVFYRFDSGPIVLTFQTTG